MRGLESPLLAISLDVLFWPLCRALHKAAVGMAGERAFAIVDLTLLPGRKPRPVNFPRPRLRSAPKKALTPFLACGKTRPTPRLLLNAGAVPPRPPSALAIFPAQPQASAPVPPPPQHHGRRAASNGGGRVGKSPPPPPRPRPQGRISHPPRAPRPQRRELAPSCGQCRSCDTSRAEPDYPPA